MHKDVQKDVQCSKDLLGREYTSKSSLRDPTLVKTLSWMLDSSLQGIGRVLILHSSALLFPFI